MPRFAVAGVLEGFYGPPWSWDERVAVMERCVPAGLPWYVWAPKSDPLHRRAWREPFTDEHLDGFRRLLAIDGLHLGVAIAPGLDPADLDEDNDALIAKVRSVVDIGATLVMIAFDDIGDDVTNAQRHIEIVSALLGAIDLSDVHVIIVPTHYATIASTPYLTALSAGLPPEVMIGWTGRFVVNDVITAAHAEAFAEVIDGRMIALWDNFPVNDTVMSDRLFLRPLVGRDPELAEHCGAYLANAGVQAWPSLPALLSAGAWVRTGVADIAWEEFDDGVNLALLAGACDGSELTRLARHLIDDDESADLWWWLERLEDLEIDGPIGEQAAPWIAQTRAEAAVALTALDLYERDRGDPETIALIVDLWRTWPPVRRSPVSVLGSRFGIEPRMGQDEAGAWTLHRGALVEDTNVTDLLCRLALTKHGA
jgi:hypothetical protein